MIDKMFDMLLKDKTKYVVDKEKIKTLCDTTRILTSEISTIGVAEVRGDDPDEEPRLVQIEARCVKEAKRLLTAVNEELKTLRYFAFEAFSIGDIARKEEFTIAEIIAHVKEKYQLLPAPILMREVKKMIIMSVTKGYLIPVKE